MSKIKQGKILGSFNEYALVKDDDKIVYIEKSEMGGEQKDNKVRMMLGSPVHFVITKEEGGMTYGSRKQALEIIKEKSKETKEKDTVKATILIVFQKSILVECLGQEAYIPAQKCVEYWVDDLTEHFEVGNDIDVYVESLNPLTLSITELKKKENWPIEMYKEQCEYIGKIKALKQDGIFVELPFNGVVMLCRKVEWKNAPQINDEVVCVVEKISKEERRIWGFIRKVVKRNTAG